MCNSRILNNPMYYQQFFLRSFVLFFGFGLVWFGLVWFGFGFVLLWFPFSRYSLCMRILRGIVHKKSNSVSITANPRTGRDFDYNLAC